MRPSNPPAGRANESGASSSGLVGEIGVSPGRSIRPTGPCGTYIDSGAEASGCSGAGARAESPPQGSSYEGFMYEGLIAPYKGGVASSE
jgi:hypothetical protein